jgi:membrane protein YdbS with pleckstrin-like domain
MGYVDTVLQPGETVRFRTNRHWVLYLPGAAIVVSAAAGLAMALTSYLAADFPTTWDTVWVGVSLVLVAIGVVVLARAWFRRRFTEIAVTDRRVVYKAGLLRRSTTEMPLDRIEKIDVDQGPLGQLLDFGNVTVNGVSSSIGKDRLRRIASPIRFRSQVIARDGGTRLLAGPVIAEIGSPSVAAAAARPGAPPPALDISRVGPVTAVPESAAVSSGR